MTKLNLKKGKGLQKSTFQRYTNFHQHRKRDATCLYSHRGNAKQRHTTHTWGGGRMWGGGMSHLQHLLPVWTPAAPPLLVVWGGVRHTPNRGEVTAASIPTAKSRQELSTTYPRTNKTWWAVSTHCLSHQRGDRLTHAVWRHRYFYPYIIFVSQTPATSENPEDVISEHLIPPRKN